MSNVPEGNQGGDPDATATPSSAGARRFTRSARGAMVMGFLLMALALAFGALGGTAAAESEDETADEIEDEESQDGSADEVEEIDEIEDDTGGEVEESQTDTGGEVEEIEDDTGGEVEESETETESDASWDGGSDVADTEESAPEPIADTLPAVTSVGVTAAVTETMAKVAGALDAAGVSNDSGSETTLSVSTTSLETEVSTMSEPAPDSISQCNAPDVVQADGREVKCSVTIDNFTTAEGVESSVVTTTKCEGPKDDVLCEAPVTTSYDGHVTTVNQCNGIINDGGSDVECDVTITNHVPVDTGTQEVTVNQCQGTGAGGGTTVTCDPSGATGGAMIDQCNGSANGGGSVVICSVDGEATAVPLTIDQCNDSANGAGDQVLCTVTVENVFIESGEGDTPPDDTPPGSTPPDDDGGDDDGDEGDDGDDSPLTGGPSTDTPLAAAPASLVSPLSTTPADSTPVPAAGSGSTGASESQASSLPATGADIGTMAAMGLMALMLGGLLLLISRSARKVTANH